MEGCSPLRYSFSRLAASQSSGGIEPFRFDPSITTFSRSDILKSEPGSVPSILRLFEADSELSLFEAFQCGGRPPWRWVSWSCSVMRFGKAVPKQGGMVPANGAKHVVD